MGMKIMCKVDGLRIFTKEKIYIPSKIQSDGIVVKDNRSLYIVLPYSYVYENFTILIDEQNIKEPELCSVMVSIKRLKENYCTKCGTSYEPEHKFCSQCGNERK
jgi:hypothetical protein